MKREVQSDEMIIKQAMIENVVNAIWNDDATALEQSAAELKTVLDKYREQNK